MIDDEDKRLLSICLLVICTGLVLVPPEELFKDDTFAHFLFSAVISVVYYQWLKEKRGIEGILFQSVVFCVTVGVLKEVAFDTVIGINDIFGDVAGAVFGVTLRSKI